MHKIESIKTGEKKYETLRKIVVPTPGLGAGLSASYLRTCNNHCMH